MSRIGWGLLPIVLSLWTVRAQAATVVIVRPPPGATEPTETLSRLRGELLALGLDVAIAERPSGRDGGATGSRAWLERIARERASDAVIDVMGGAAAATVDILIVQRATGQTGVTRVALEPNAANAAERLAIRAIEVLRSNLVEIDLAARRHHPAAPLPAPPPPEADRASAPRAVETARFALEAGAAVLTSLDGVGPAFLPTARFGWAANSWLGVQGSFTGFGSRPTVANASGSARVAQHYGLLGGCFCAPSARVFRPYAGLSVGVLRTSIAGEASAPEQAHVIQSWSFLVDASVGARLHLPGRYHLTLAAHVQVAQPYVAIHFVDARLATTGLPNVLVSLTVGAWL